MKKQPICGYSVKSVDNSSGSVLTSLTTIYSLIHKIVTKTEILALVSLQPNTNFTRYRPILGDMPKVINNLEGPLFIDLAATNGTVTKLVT